MFGSVVLELFIGIAFLFLVLSLVVTTAQELIAGVLGMRAANLVIALRNLLDDADGSIVSEVLDHPTLRRLYRGKARSKLMGFWGNGPSYVPSTAFATALLDTLRARHGKGTAEPVSFEDLFGMAPDVVREMPDGSLKRALTLMVGHVTDQDRPVARRVEQVEQRLAQWFEESMDRASGWYKRKSQAISILLSIILVIAVNANALTYMETLWKDAALRDAIVAVAETSTGESDPLSPDVQGLLNQLGLLPLGWAEGETLATLLADPLIALKSLSGWAITILAISLGAAFWFDLTKNALSLRSSGPTPKAKTSG